MQSLLVILLLLVPTVLPMRCYDYMNNNQMQNNLHTWVDCPFNTMFCYKSYIESRDFNGQKTWLESRSCGTPNLCQRGLIDCANNLTDCLCVLQREGCMGDDKDRACCCDRELCNSAESKTVLLGSVATVLLYFFH